MSDTSTRVIIMTNEITVWLDGYPGKSQDEVPPPRRVDGVSLRARGVNRFVWLRSEFGNMQIEHSGVPADPDSGTTLGNRGQRGPNMRADDALAKFGDRPANNTVALIRGRKDSTQHYADIWADSVQLVRVYEIVATTDAVRRGWEFGPCIPLYYDEIPRTPVDGLTYTQEQLVYGFSPTNFRTITDHAELQQGKRLGPESALDSVLDDFGGGPGVVGGGPQ